MTKIEWITPYPSRPNRGPRFQFTLRTLFLITTGCAVLAAVAAQWGVAGIFFLFVTLAVWQLGHGIFKRRDGAVVSGGFALIALFVIAIPLFQVARWGGHRTVSLRFVVSVESDGKPIASAIVRIRQVDEVIPPPATTLPPGERGVQSSTGTDGTAVLNEEFPTSGSSGWVEDYGYIYFGRSSSPRYDEFWVQVSAPGCATYLAPLSSLIGEKRDYRDPVPPPLQIVLHRDPIAQSK